VLGLVLYVLMFWLIFLGYFEFGVQYQWIFCIEIPVSEVSYCVSRGTLILTHYQNTREVMFHVAFECPVYDNQVYWHSCDLRTGYFASFHWYYYPLPSPPVYIIWAMMIVWRIRGNIIRTVLCCVVYDNCAQWYAHTRAVLTVECWC